MCPGTGSKNEALPTIPYWLEVFDENYDQENSGNGRSIQGNGG